MILANHGIVSSSGGVLPIVTSGLILNLDANNVASYPGSGTIWTDLSPTGVTSTLTNGAAYSSENGGVILFDGVNDYGITSSNAAYNLTDITVSTWVKPTTGGADFTPVITRYFDTTAYNGWYLYYIKSTQKFTISGRESAAANLSLTSVSNYSINNWLNVVWTKSGSNWKLYINSTLDNSSSLGNGTTAFGSNTLYIGAVTDNPLAYGKQNIGAAYIYNRALSLSEITQNFNATKTRYGL